MIPDILNSIIIKCNARSTVHSAHRCVLTRFFEKIFLAGDLKFEIPEDSYSPKKQVRSDRILGLHLKSKLIYMQLTHSTSLKKSPSIPPLRKVGMSAIVLINSFSKQKKKILLKRVTVIEEWCNAVP